MEFHSSRGVREYWIADWRSRQLEVYRRENSQLKLVATLLSDDTVTSPLLSSFRCTVGKFFPQSQNR